MRLFISCCYRVPADGLVCQGLQRVSPRTLASMNWTLASMNLTLASMNGALASMNWSLASMYWTLASMNGTLATDQHAAGNVSQRTIRGV